ncbi:unnamed protein product, partial [Polarella glacialis]
MSDLKLTVQRRKRQGELEKQKATILPVAGSPSVVPGVEAAGGFLERGRSRTEAFRLSFPNLAGLFRQSLYPKSADQEARELLSSDPVNTQAGDDGDETRQEPGMDAGGSEAELPPRIELPPRLDPDAAPHPPGMVKQSDATLVAMAGKNARHFVPEKLPWQVLRNITRVLQLCWFWCFLMGFLKEAEIYQVDFQQHPGKEGRRRLCRAEVWAFERLDVEWPHGSFFRPQGLFCMPGGGREFLVGSPFAVYKMEVSTASGTPFQLSEVTRSRLPPATIAVCEPRQSIWTDAESNATVKALAGTPVCLMLAPVKDGLQVWSMSSEHSGESTVSIHLEGEPWRLVAGATVRCTDVAGLLPEQEVGVAEWCLLLA